MNWLSFFIGVLVGWLIEWLIDILYWRRRDPALRREADILQVRLEQAESRVRELQEREAEWKVCQQRLVEAEATIEELEARFHATDTELDAEAPELELPDADMDLDVDERGISGLKARFTDKDVEVVAPPVQRQDLGKIEGIGPKISQLLHDGGILSFAQLAETEVSRLQEILDAAGPNFQLADPETWPQQARLAAAEEWQALEKLKDELIGGRTRHFHDGKPAAD